MDNIEYDPADLSFDNNGDGYLYATQEEETIKFIGQNTDDYNLSDTKEVPLGQGFNLVGNPFPRAAYVDRSYYKLNSDGSIILAEPVSAGTYISPCNGVIVQGNADEMLTFGTMAPNTSGDAHNKGNLQIVLAQTTATRGEAGMKALDNAIVSFNEGSQLGKFYFGTQKANIYIPQNGKDYAIVSAEAQGEMPLNFKAHENGTYTLTISEPLNSKFLTLNYLHLIDNLTGADIDLLATPSYSFEASTTDYASRFKLLFNTQQSEEGADADFAFISNGNLIVSGEGTLQIIDMLGHILLNREAHSDSCLLPSDFLPSGVYVLRLINGDDVKTQKIVVR